MELYKKKTRRDYIEMLISFPPDYPFNPPFVRVIQPRFQFHTGRVTVGGSLCTDVLTDAGWSPIYTIEYLMLNIISLIIEGEPRIDFNNMYPYTLNEAKSAFQRVAAQHNWKINSWLPE